MMTGLTGEAIAEVGQWYKLYSVNDARSLFGAGSVGALMAIQHFATCPELPLFMAPLPAPTGTGAQAAVFKMTVSGPATGSGILSIAVLDMQFAIGVIVGSTAASVTSALVAAFNANTDFPFVATIDNGDIVLTSKTTGPAGNWFSPVFNPNFGERSPMVSRSRSSRPRRVRAASIRPR